jgi:hypothetical protein
MTARPSPAEPKCDCEKLPPAIRAALAALPPPERERAALVAFARDALHEFWDSRSGPEMQELGIRHGLLVETKYDPEIHGEHEYASEMEPGDPWFVFADWLKSQPAGEGLPEPPSRGEAGERATPGTRAEANALFARAARNDSPAIAAAYLELLALVRAIVDSRPIDPANGRTVDVVMRSIMAAKDDARAWLRKWEGEAI